MASLGTARGALKLSITAHSKYLQTVATVNIAELKLRCERLQAVYSKYTDIIDATDTLNEINEEEHIELSDRYFSILGTFQGMIVEHAAQTAVDKGPKPSHVNVKLPDIPIPQFDGNFSHWQQFRDTFVSIIVENSNLSQIAKFHYLSTALLGEPKALIANLPVTETNFQVAWDLLIQRYENVKLIATDHLRKLFSPPSYLVDSPQSLRAIIDHYVSHINALQALSLSVPLHDLLLSHILTHQFDAKLLREWEDYIIGDNMPTFKQLTDFLERKCKVLEVIQAKPTAEAQTPKYPFGGQAQNFSSTSPSKKGNVDNTAFNCSYCSNHHYLGSCRSFQQLPVNKRWDFIRRERLCQNCLRAATPNHPCSNKRCRHCDKLHNSILHNTQHTSRPQSDGRNQNLSNDNRTQHTNPTCATSLTDSPPNCLLPTAEVKIFTKQDSTTTCTALLDSGSNCHLISKRLVKRLHLPVSNTSTRVQGIGHMREQSNLSVSLKISSRDNTWSQTINCLVVNSITPKLPHHNIDVSWWNFPRDLPLADPRFNVSKPIDLLLAADVVFDILCDGKITPIRNDAPFIVNSKLGWFFSGNLPGHFSSGNAISAFTVAQSGVQEQLSKFWTLEEVQPYYSSDNQFCENHFHETTKRTPEGRYIVKLPVKKDSSTLGSSSAMALKRFHALERRLSKDSNLRQTYLEFMAEYEQLGHMKCVSPLLDNEQGYYIPHHPVFKATSTTTKLRVVFDASAKTSNGISLNDILVNGPVVQPELFSTLLKFRLHPIAYVADITKMYRQILVSEEDTKLQRILWRSSQDEPIQEFALQTITYGTTPASYLSTRVLNQLVIDEGKHLPYASKAILDSFYVDDCISGSQTLEQAIQTYHEINQLLASGGFEIRKWSSNSAAFLKHIPIESQETQELRAFGDEDDNCVRTLGLLWRPNEDLFHIATNEKANVNTSCFTKRTFLSYVASIWDPLGLISPVVISCKILFQTLWTSKIEWDDTLPPDVHQQWLQILTELPQIAHVAIPRFMSAVSINSIHLIGFSDASQKAYGACVYFRVVDGSNNVKSNLICSKSKVAPLKSLSIPKLELCAALLLARLIHKVKSSIGESLSSTYLFTDSTITLAWISSSPSKWKPFVANRVAAIQELTSDCTWSHVDSHDNPADLISRGIGADRLQSCILWWNGPSWLRLHTSDWPNNHPLIATSTLVNPPEQRRCLLIVKTSDEFSFFKFSSYDKTLRVMAYCLRFINNCTSKQAKRFGLLSTDEISNSLVACVKLVQRQHFLNEITTCELGFELNHNSSLHSFYPFLHSDGTLRVGGRLENSNLPFDAKHQFILPTKHHFTTLIVRNTHLRLLHGGFQLTVATVRELFWIPALKRLVRSIIRSCLICFKHHTQASQQLMGQLPAVRVLPSFTFANVGIDYAGPITIKHGGPRSKATTKAYIALFVCLSTKAIHLEIVTSMSTQAFLTAFARFTSRRGLPSIVYSDNGTNFKGASHEMNELYSLLSSEEHQQNVQNATLNSFIQWHFIPPSAPHFGGIWEAGVKSVKHHLKRVTNRQVFTYEEFSTLTAQIEAVLNSRPLFSIDEPQEFHYLSPGHFLIGRPLTTLPMPNLVDVPINRLSRWQHIQRMLTVIWKNWSSDYLQTLQQRSKWSNSNPNLNIDDLVIIKDDNTPPLKWVLGRIVELHPGKDDKVRVVTLRTPHGIFKRPIHKLARLPCQDLESYV